MSYYFAKTLDCGFEEAVARTTEALKKAGFGIITEIDVQETFRKKLGLDFRPYRILGACNPPIAHQSLQAEPDVGLLLPCNVVVRQDADKVVVEALDPEVQLGIADNPALAAMARDARERLTRALERLPGA